MLFLLCRIGLFRVTIPIPEQRVYDSIITVFIIRYAQDASYPAPLLYLEAPPGAVLDVDIHLDIVLDG